MSRSPRKDVPATPKVFVISPGLLMPSSASSPPIMTGAGLLGDGG
jgi:hypothetical protein